MTASMFLKIMRFYVRFTPSFTRLGYYARRPFWQDDNRDYSEQRWLVTGASGGIGEAIVSGAVNCGATVTAVARDSKKLALLTDARPRYVNSIVTDLSLQTEVELLAKKLIFLRYSRRSSLTSSITAIPTSEQAFRFLTFGMGGSVARAYLDTS